MPDFYSGQPASANFMQSFQQVAGLRNTMQMAKLRGMEAQKMGMELQKQKLLMQQLSGVTSGAAPKTTDEITQQLTKEAGVYAKAGYVKESADIMEKLSMLHKNEMATEASQEKAMEEHLKLYAMLHPEDPTAQDKAMTAKERYETKREAKNDAFKRIEENARVRELEARTKLDRERLDKLKKTGSKAAAKEDVKYADDTIAVDYPMMEDKERDLYARQLSERALQLRTANPALSNTEATAQAYSEMQKGGSFKNFVKKAPKLSPEQTEQKKLVEDWGAKYDPEMEYKVENGQLFSRPREGEAPIKKPLEPDYNDPSWYRSDHTKKGKGFLGILKVPGKDEVATEYSVGVEINGKEMDIPTLVPTLTHQEVQEVLEAVSHNKLPSNAIIRKAAAFAKKRIAEGKSVFANQKDGDY